MNLEKIFSDFATRTARMTGQPVTFLACVALVLVWAISGPAFKFSETWQLVINTGTTIITFLMVFLIQNTQNRDSEAMHAKLDELILTSAAENDFIGIETLTDKELQSMQQRCAKAAASHHNLHERLGKEVDRRKSEKAKKSGQSKAAALRKAA